jgi:hypothetical protein
VFFNLIECKTGGCFSHACAPIYKSYETISNTSFYNNSVIIIIIINFPPNGILAHRSAPAVVHVSSIITVRSRFFSLLICYPVYKGKVITLQAWTGPEGSRRLRLPDFKEIGT